jgi:hypothetical protein
LLDCEPILPGNKVEITFDREELPAGRGGSYMRELTHIFVTTWHGVSCRQVMSGVSGWVVSTNFCIDISIGITSRRNELLPFSSGNQEKNPSEDFRGHFDAERLGGFARGLEGNIWPVEKEKVRGSSADSKCLGESKVNLNLGFPRPY